MRNTNYQSRSAQFNSLEASKPARWRRNAANLIAAAATSALLGVLSSSASATTTTLYWGGGTGAITNGTAPAGGSGNWDTSTSNWSQDPTLGTIYQAWPASGEAYSANFNKTAGTVTIDGTGVQADALIFSTTGYTIAGSALDNLTFIGVTPTVTTGAGITATINAPIGGFVGFTDAGGGTLALGGSNTYSGSTIVTGASTLLLNNTNAAQNSTLTEAVGGGSLSFASGVGTVNLAGLSWTDNIALTDLGSNAVNLSIGGYNTSSTYAGILSGGGSLTKVGSGMFTLSNTGAQLLTGNVTLNSGYLRVISSGLGSGTVTLAGGIFDLGSATANAYNNPVNVSGSSLIVLDRGVAGAGVTQTFGNLNINAPFVDVVSNAFTTSLNAGLTFGNVTLAAPTTLMVDASTAAPGTSQQTALTTGSITGNFNLNVATQNQATVTVNGSIGTMGDTSTLNKYGPGTLTIATGNALNSSGQVNITGGNLTLAGSTTALNVSNFVVNGGATLQLGTNGVTQVAQIGATANVTLNGGALYGASPSGTNLITTAGNLIIGPGESSLSGQGATGTGTHILQFNSITIGPGGVFNAGPEQNAYTTSDAIFLGNFATYGNGQSNATNPANPGMVNGVIVGMLFNGDFATVNTAPAALGSNPGGFPSLVPGSITSLDYNGPANNYGFYNGDLTLSEVGQGSGAFAVANDGTVSILEELSGTITLPAGTNLNVNAINISPNSAPPSYVTNGTYTSEDGGVTTPGPLTYNLSGNTLTLTTGELLASTTDGNTSGGTANNPISIRNGILTSATQELLILNDNSTSQWSIASTITDGTGGSVSLVRGGPNNSSLYLSGENTFTGNVYLDSPATTTILTERQLGAQPATLNPAAITLSNGSTLAFAYNIPPTLSPLRGITVNGGTSTIEIGNYFNTPANAGIGWVLASPITGNGGVTIADQNFGSVIITGANTYDGQTALGGGNYVVSFLTINNIGSNTPSSFGEPSNAYNGRLTFASSNNNATYNYVGVGNASTDRQFDLNDTASQNINANGTGSLTLNGNLLVSNGGGTSSAGITLGGYGVGVINGDLISSLTGGSVPFKLNVNGNVLNSWTFTGANNYDGVLSVASGSTAQFTTVGTVGSGPSALGAPSTVANGTIALGSGVLRFIGSTSQTTDRVITAGGGALEASGINGANLTWNGAITDSSALIVGGLGTGNLTGTITGSAGIIKGGEGTWTINPAAVEPYTGATVVSGGTLVLDSSNLATPTNLLASASTFNLSGGSLSLLGKSGNVTTSQTFAGFTTFKNTGSQLLLNSNGGNSLTVSTGNWSHGAGSTVNIVEIGTTSITTGTISLPYTNGVLPYATINGADFAQGIAAGGALSVFTAYTAGGLPTSGGANANSYNLSGGIALTGNVALNALKITGSGNLNISSYTIGNGNAAAIGILYDGTGGNTYTMTGTTGVIGSGGQELVTNVNNGTLTISANLGNTSGTFDKAGNGTLVLAGTQTYAGQTNVNWGTLQAGSTTGLSPNSLLNVDLSGAVGGGLNNATVALSGFSSTVLALTGNGVITNSSATPATLTIGTNAPVVNQNGYTQTFSGLLQDGTGGGALSIVKAGTGEEVLTGSVNNPTTGWNDSYSGSLTIADGNLDSPFINNVGVNGPLGTSSTAVTMGSTSHTGILGFSGVNGTTNRNFTVAAGGGEGFDITPDGTTGSGTVSPVAQTLFGATLNLSGSLSGSGPTLKLGQGNLILSGNNSAYTGNYVVTGGMLQFASSASIGTGTITLRDGGVVSITSGPTDLSGGMNQAFLNRVTVAADSVGVVALGSNSNSNLNFNTSNLANANLGAAVPLTYTGVLTPYGNTYRLGGGGTQSAITFPNANELTGANNLVVNPGGSSNNNSQSPATIVLGDAQNYTGATTISGGNSMTFQGNGTGVTATIGNASLDLAGANANIASTSGVTINNGGILRFIESAGDVSKLGSAPLTLNGGTLEQDTDSATTTNNLNDTRFSFSQTVASTLLNRGASAIYVSAGSTALTGLSDVLTLNNLTRNPGATVNFATNLNATTTQLILGGTPALGAWAFVNSNDFAMYNGSTSNVIAIGAATANSDSGWSATSNDTVNASFSLTAAATDQLNTLKSITTATTITVGTASLAINGVMGSSSALTIGTTAGDGTLTAAESGNGELVVASLSASVIINSNIKNPTGGTATATTLVKSGTSSVTIAGTASSYTGGLDLNQGTLVVSNINALPGATPGSVSPITINGGFLDVTGGTANGLAGGTVWSNPITVNSDAAFLNTNTNNYAGTLTLANGSNLFLQANGTSTTADILSGTITGTGNVYFAGSGGVYRTIAGTTSNNYSGNTYVYGDENNANAGGLDLTLNKSGGAFAIPGDLYLGRTSESNSTLTGFPEKVLIGNNTDQFNTSSTIYFAGGHGNDAGDLEIFGTNTQVVIGLQSLMPGDGVIENSNASNGVFTDNVPAAVTRTFSGTIGNAVIGNGTNTPPAGTLAMVFSGLGTQVIASAANTYTGGTTVNSGTLVLASGGAYPAGGSLNTSSGAQVIIANHGSFATYVPQVNLLANNGSIDVTNNAFLVQNGSIGAVTAQVALGYNNGTWNGTNASSGVITSSTAAADSTHLTAVGVATGFTSFEGLTVPATDVLVKYTYYGDTNLDGKVDGTDYSRIDNGYLLGLTGWQNGDFNYDGVIDGSDYTLIDNAYNTQGATIAAEVAGPSGSIAASSASSAVPEPATLGLLGIGAIGLLGRRRHRLAH